MGLVMILVYIACVAWVIFLLAVFTAPLWQKHYERRKWDARWHRRD